MGKSIKIGEFMAEVWHDGIYTSETPDLRQELHYKQNRGFYLVQQWPAEYPGKKITIEPVHPGELPDILEAIEIQGGAAC